MTVIKPSINGTRRTRIEIEIFVEAKIDRLARIIPAAVAPNPHINLDGFQVYGASPREAPAVIIASYEK
jgi:hypothetical protein